MRGLAMPTLAYPALKPPALSPPRIAVGFVVRNLVLDSIVGVKLDLQ